MRRCYMSYELLQKYLRQTIACELLFYDYRINRYHITHKGTAFLEIFDRTRDIQNELESRKKILADMLG
jgi:predicted transcriptional regulator